MKNINKEYYSIELNNKYGLIVGKELKISSNNEMYILITGKIKRIEYLKNYYTNEPFIFFKSIYEKKRLSKIIGSWESRVEKAEQKLIKRAMEIVENNFPILE